MQQLNHIKYLFYFALLCFALSSAAQQPITKTFNGLVTNALGQPIAGASVRLAASNQQTISAANGGFSVQLLATKDTLVVTHVNYHELKLAVGVATLSVFTLQLTEKGTVLNEVTVETGFQSIPKERATGSFSKLGQNLLQQQVGTSILSRLEGIANGISVDKKRASAYATGIMVRGLSTIGGPKDPLVVVDNFPYEGDLNNINPNDVASITILKDAAATSIWGARAGNGVIVITTNKASFNQKLQVAVNANLTVVNKPNIWYTQPIRSADYIEIEQFLYAKGFYNSSISSTLKPALSPVIALLLQQDNGQITASQLATQLQALGQLDVRNDFDKYIYQTALNQQYAITLQGGGQQQNWLLSASYDANKNELAAKYNRWTLKSENTIQLSSRLQVQAGINVVQSNTGSGKQGYGSMGSGNSSNTFYPYTQLADANGNALAVNKNYRQTYLDTIGGGKLLNWNYYPLTDYQHSTTSVVNTDILANLGLQYQFNSQLTANLRYRYEQQWTTTDNNNDIESYYTRNLINSFTQINYNTGQLTNIVPKGSIVDKTTNTLIAHHLRAQLNYQHHWLQHSIAAIAGVEIKQTKNDKITQRTYGFNPDNLTFGSVDYNTTFPQLVTGYSAFIPNNNTIAQTDNRFVSTFANAAYTYRERYTLSASARRDASNLFGVNTNNKWSPLWSVGAAWHLSQEPFFKVAWLPYLKLSATYGASGNIDPSQSAVTTIQYGSVSPYTSTPIATVSKRANPDLRWEKSTQFNLRLEYRMAGNKLSGSIEYFQKKGTDLYGLVPNDYTTGIGNTVLKNSAAMLGKGWDIELNSNQSLGKLQWATSLLINLYNDKVTDYYTASAGGSNYILSANTYSLSPMKGYPVYAVLSYPWAGLDPSNGDPRGIYQKQVSKDYNALVNDSVQNLVYNGPAMPTAQIALRNTFKYKQWELTLNLLGKFGYYFRRETIDYTNLFNNGVGHADYAKRWQQAGDENHTNIPALVYPLVGNRETFYQGATPFVEKGDHIRLQYIHLAYKLTKAAFKKWPTQSLQLFANANNLGILWRANQLHLDPDYLPSTIPPAKSFSIGINATF